MQAKISSQAEPVVSVRNLGIAYEMGGLLQTVVDQVSFDIRAQARIGLAGESGSGKTQMLLAIMGLLHAYPGLYSGDLHILGTNVLASLSDYCQVQRLGDQLQVRKKHASWLRHSERQMKPLRGSVVSMIFQEAREALAPYFTVGQHFKETMVKRLRLPDANMWRAAATQILEQLSIPEPETMLSKYPDEMSGGECQRVMLALSLIGDPIVLLADEPTTAVDAEMRLGVLDTICTAMESSSRALVTVSHNLAELTYMTDELLVMHSGRLVERGPTHDVISHKYRQHPYTRELILAAISTKKISGNRPQEMKGPTLLGGRKGCLFAPRCKLYHKLSESDKKRCIEERPPPKLVGPDHEIACWGV